jgi:hypothetical protein
VRRRRLLLTLAASLAAVGAVPALAQDAGRDLCADAPEGVKCIHGKGRQTEGGGGKVSHKGWPPINGVVWVLDHKGRSGVATELNDELLGGHGSDRLDGADGNDVIWGDMWSKGNNERQRDTLIGGNGNDWLYASHGRNVIDGGAGRDTIWSYFAVRVTIRAGAGNDRIWVKNGAGRVDCGPGRDVLHVPLAGYSHTGCEVIKHYCSFGDDGHGGCKKRGTRRR